MSRIQNIKISNFKFFGKCEEIKLNGKNLLLYGENGSGKSSIYNALYTIIEASSKQPAEIKKYFKPLSEENPSSLLNIYAPIDKGNENTGAYIEVEDERRVYRLSYSETNICEDVELQESHRVTDFINYQSLFRFQIFKNSEITNLHDVFEYSVIPYLTCPSFQYKGDALTTLSELFKKYYDQDSLKQSNHNRRRERMVIYKRAQPYQDFLRLENKINDELRTLIEDINVYLPDILSKLGYDFRAYLTFNELSHHKYDTWIQYFPYKIGLEIDQYNGTIVNIKHPNIFLNEAKMAALAFAIRWAILMRRPSKEIAPNAIRVLVLDDLMISLDMGNRNKLIHFLLTDTLAQDYQLLFMTHERLLFNCFLQNIKLHYDMVGKKMDEEWLFLDMYDCKVQEKHFPSIQPYKSAYSRALSYLDGVDCPIDYCASGNALRQAVEEEFDRLFRLCQKEIPTSNKEKEHHVMLNEYITNSRDLFNRYGFDVGILNRLKVFTNFLLNPTSHFNPTSTYYRNELVGIIDVYQILHNYQIEILLPSESKLVYEVSNPDGDIHPIEITLHDNMRIARCSSNERFHIVEERYSMHLKDSYYPDGENTIKRTDSLRHIIHNSYQQIKKAKIEDVIIDNYAGFVQCNGETLKEILDRKNG